MEPAQNAAVRQAIVRMYQPDMQLLKTAVKQIAVPGIKPQLYGKGGEVLLVFSAASAPAAENAAQQLEAAMGECVYGRGKAGLAHVAANALLADESEVAAADELTGELLGAELKSSAHGQEVFDFGETSYLDPRMAAKIEKASLLDDTPSPLLYQLASDRSFAAAKCTKCEFGVAITGTQQFDAQMVCVAVTYGKFVYVRCIRPSAEAAKTAALTALDTIRRLLAHLPVPYARIFHAGAEIDWDQPVAPAQAGKSTGKSWVVPVSILAAVVLVLGGLVWYIVSTFSIPNKGESMPASTSASSVASSVQPAQSTPDAPAESTPAAPAESTPAAPAGNTGGVVHPF